MLAFTLLGEVRVERAGARVDLGGPRQRALLARLLLVPGHPVGRDQLVADVFEHAASGPKALQVAVSRLRRALDEVGAGDRLRTTPAGYVLDAEEEELDAARLDALVDQGARAVAAGQWGRAIARLRVADALWLGPPLGGVPTTGWALAAAGRLREQRLRAASLRAEAQLALGRHDEVAAELAPLVAEHPEREQLRASLMLARYRAGQQAEALALYREGHRHLVELHGVSPGDELRRLHQRMLEQDPALLVATAAAPLPVRLRRPAEQPLVGRAAEQALLDEALAESRAGARVAVVVSGEPGIGKTRLVSDLGATARALGATVLAGRGDEAPTRGFQPFAEALDELAPTLDDALLADHAAAHGAVLARLVPALAARLPGGDAQDLDAGIAGSQQYALFAAVTDLLDRVSRAAPVVLVLEDLQWADPPSLLLLRHLLTAPLAARLLVAATFRAGEEPAALAALLAEAQREPSTRRIELAGLDGHQVAELAAELDPAAARDPAVVEALRGVTGGNPFFLTELLRAGDATSRALGTAAAPPLPPSVREAIDARVRRLGAVAVRVLETGALLGVEFEPALAATVAELDLDAVDGALRAARDAGLVEEAGALTAFRHALIPRTLVDALTPAQRAALHRRAAQALEARGRGMAARHAAELARHWAGAGGEDGRRGGVRWARTAGHQALAQLAGEPAQRWFAQALALHDAGPADAAARAALLVELGTAQRDAGDAASRETLLAAARTGAAADRPDLLVRAALENTRGFVSAVGGADDEVIAVLELALDAVGPQRTAARAQLLATLGGELTFATDWTRRAALSDEALAIAREVGDPAALVHVLTTRNITIWRPETLPERLANTEEALRAADRLGDPVTQFNALHWRASACVQTGHWAEAAAARARSRELAVRVRQPTVMWMSAYDDADEHIGGGRLAAAEASSAAGLEVGQASGQPDAPLIFASQLVVLRHDQGRLSELTELIAQTLEFNPRLTGYRSVLALAYCEQGDLETAARTLAIDAPGGFAGVAPDLTWLSVMCTYAHVAARTIPAGSTPAADGVALREHLTPWVDQVAYIGPAGGRLVAHHLGMLEVALDELDAGCAHLEHAVVAADRLPAPLWAARARVELARGLAARGDVAAAHALLDLAGPAASALGADGVARDADALLVRVG